MIPEISAILGAELSPEPSDEGALYRGFLPGIDVSVVDKHGLVTDGPLDFPSYSIQINLGPLRESKDHDDHIREIAYSLARQINAMMRCPTMVTQDVQRLLKRFD